jgi:hypothetical protein
MSESGNKPRRLLRLIVVCAITGTTVWLAGVAVDTTLGSEMTGATQLERWVVAVADGLAVGTVAMTIVRRFV